MIPDQFEAFAQRATADIDDPRERREAAAEITDHLMEVREELRHSGASDQSAISGALERMGAVDEIAKPLGGAHRPPWRPSVIVVAILSGLGLLAVVWLGLIWLYNIYFGSL